MIGATGEDRRGAVQLFAQHKPNHHVRPDHFAKGYGKIRPRAQRWINTVRAANDKRRRIGASIGPML